MKQYECNHLDSRVSGFLWYLTLTFLPGILIPAEGHFLAEIPVRFLIPGALAAVLAIQLYGARLSGLGLHGLSKSLLCCSPIVIPCLINLLTGSSGPLEPLKILWVCAGATAEELIGRMLLVSALAANGRKRAAIVIAAVLFGMSHLVNIPAAGIGPVLWQCAYTAFLGGLIAWSYLKTGNLWGGILWHILLNLTGLL